MDMLTRISGDAAIATGVWQLHQDLANQAPHN